MKLLMTFVVILIISYIAEYEKNKKIDLSVSMVLIKITLALVGASIISYMYSS
jgi:hypothetical protein